MCTTLTNKRFFSFFIGNGFTGPALLSSYWHYVSLIFCKWHFKGLVFFLCFFNIFPTGALNYIIIFCGRLVCSWWAFLEGVPDWTWTLNCSSTTPHRCVIKGEGLKEQVAQMSKVKSKLCGSPSILKNVTCYSILTTHQGFWWAHSISLRFHFEALISTVNSISKIRSNIKQVPPTMTSVVFIV